MDFSILYEGDEIVPNNDTSMYSLVKFEETKDMLNKYKSMFDKYDVNDNMKKRFDTIRNALDHFRQFKKVLRDDYGAEHPSNAFLKMYEMLDTYKIFENYAQSNKLTTFHNAEFPGSFILACKHYILSHFSKKLEWKWYGSSRLDGALTDSYGLYENNKSNWLMNDKHTGDVTHVDYQLYLKEKIGGTIDVYTADLGFGVEDHNNQETAQAHANLGQIVSALLTIRKGGAFITKQYTIFEPFSVSLIVVLASLFENFSIIKPSTSRSLNSETYLFGQGYKGMSTTTENILLERLDNFNMLPLISIDNIPKDTIASILYAVVEISKQQAKKIKQFVDCDKLFAKYSLPVLYNKILVVDANNREESQKEFFTRVTFKHAASAAKRPGWA